MIVTLHNPADVARAEAAARTNLSHAGLPVDWARTGPAYEDQYLRIERCAVRFSSGSLGTYLKVKLGRQFNGGVAVVTLHGDRLVLVRQFRFPSQRDHLEVPRGFVEQGESALAGAKRELAEETGATLSSMEHIGEIWPDTGLLSWSVAVFVARVSQVGSISDDEVSEVVEMPVSELDDAIAAGLIDDGISLSALGLARAKKNLAR